MPRRTCGGCNFTHYKASYSALQWNRSVLPSHCKDCIARLHRAGTPLQCTFCTVWKPLHSFLLAEQQPNRDRNRVCVDCVPKYPCQQCGEYLTRDYFKAHAWEAARGSRKNGNALCVQCTQPAGRPAGSATTRWMCTMCGQSKAKAAYRVYLASGKKTPRACDACLTPSSAAELSPIASGSAGPHHVLHADAQAINSVGHGSADAASQSPESASPVTTLQCAGCKQDLSKDSYSKQQLMSRDRRRCKECVRKQLLRYQSAGGHWRCIRKSEG